MNKSVVGREKKMLWPCNITILPTVRSDTHFGCLEHIHLFFGVTLHGFLKIDGV